MHIQRALLSTVLVLTLPLAPAFAQTAPTSRAEADPMSDKAVELFNEGKKLFRDGKYGQAEAAFEAAWAIALKSKGIAANLGEAEMHLGKFREAAEHLTISLRLAAPDDSQRPRTAANLATVKAKIATLTVKTNVDGAEIFVNGKKVADAPLLDPIFVDPGKVKLRVRLEGYLSWEKEIDATAGQELPLDVTMERPAPVPPVTASATALVPPPPPPRSKVPAFVAGGVGLIGIAVGAGLHVGAGGKRIEGDQLLANTQRAAGAQVVCPGRAECAQIKQLRQDKDALANGGTGALIAGGVALVGAAVYFFWPAPKPAPSTASWMVAPVVSSTEAGLGVTGRF